MFDNKGQLDQTAAVLKTIEVARLQFITVKTVDNSAAIMHGQKENIFDNCASTCVTLMFGKKRDPSHRYLHFSFKRADVYLNGFEQTETAQNRSFLVRFENDKDAEGIHKYTDVLMDGTRTGWQEARLDTNLAVSQGYIDLYGNFKELQLCSVDLYGIFMIEEL